MLKRSFILFFIYYIEPKKYIIQLKKEFDLLDEDNNGFLSLNDELD